MNQRKAAPGDRTYVRTYVNRSPLNSRTGCLPFDTLGFDRATSRWYWCRMSDLSLVQEAAVGGARRRQQQSQQRQSAVGSWCDEGQGAWLAGSEASGVAHKAAGGGPTAAVGCLQVQPDGRTARRRRSQARSCSRYAGRQWKAFLPQRRLAPGCVARRGSLALRGIVIHRGALPGGVRPWPPSMAVNPPPRAKQVRVT